MSAVINRTLQTLTIEHEWLGKDTRKTAHLNELLHEALTHAGKDAVQLIAQLISRFVYVSNDEYDEFIMTIAEFLLENFDLNQSILCATTADRNKDSAQVVLYDTVTALAGLGVYKPKNVNRYDRALDSFKSDPSLREIILIDEFVGTGQSILGRAKSLKKSFAQAGRQPPPIHFVGLAGMSFGLRHIEPYLNSVNICLSLQRGIRGTSLKQNHATEYALMDMLESNLSTSYEDVNLPNYGYGKSEALYSRKSGNCPNNVFPIFWWPQLISSGIRNPMFPRSM